MWGPNGMMGYGYGWMPFMGMIFWLLILFLIVAGVMAFMRHNTDNRMDGTPRRSAAREILEERYARGDINREEYLQKKQDILAGT
jgi:putative membrane protein